MPGRSIGTAFVEIDLDSSRYLKSQQKLYKDATTTTLNIEENFRKLGVKSSAEMNLMRAKITNAYNMIARSSKATANDIIRAEKAKNQKLKQLAEQQYGHQNSLLQSLKKNWIALGATIYTAMRFGRMIDGWLKSADAIGKQADAIGLSTSALQEYQHAARISGVSTQQFDSAVAGFTKRIGELRYGTGELYTRLQKMDEGLLSNLQSVGSTEKALELMFKGLDKTTSAIDKAALSAAAFGRTGGIAMVNMVRDGYKELERMRQEAEALGIVLDETLVRNSEKANDQLEIMNRILKTQLMTTALQLAPAITSVAGGIADMATAMNNLIRGLGELSKFEMLLKILAFGIPVGQNVGERPGEYKAEMEKLRPGAQNVSPGRIVLDPIPYMTEAEKLLRKEWKRMAEGIGADFNDALVNSLDDGLDSFKDFAKDVKQIFVKLWMDKAITQPLIMPQINKLAGMFGFTGKGIDSTTGGFAGFMGSNAFGMTDGATYGQMLGAGAVGYGIGGIGGGVGAAGGMAMGSAYLGSTLGSFAGPVGAIAGGIIVPKIIDLFESEEPEIPSYKMLWETVDGQIQSVVQEWENMDPNQEVFKAAQKVVQGQLDFFNKLAVISGQVAPSFSFDISGVGKSINETLKQKTTELIIGSSLGSIKQISSAFGPGFKDELKEIFTSTLSPMLSMFTFGDDANVFNKYIDWKFEELAALSPEQSMESFQKWMESASIFSPVGRRGIHMSSIFDLFTSRNPDFSSGDFNEDMFQQLEQFASQATPGWLTRGEIALSPESSHEPWEAFFEDITQKVNELFPLIEMGMGNAFAASLQSPGFGEFEANFKTSIFSIMKNSLTEAYVQQGLLPVALEPFLGSTNRPDLGTIMEQYTGGDLTFDQTMGYVNDMVSEFNGAIETLRPVWEVFNTALTGMSDALGLNTTAIGSNTDAIMGPVNSFLMSLDTGPLAPSQSLAGIMSMGQELYTAALADPSQFSAYASYMTGTGLPTIQGLSDDYAGAVSGVRAGVMDMPWVQQGMGTSPSAQSIGYEVGQALAPMLSNIAESGQITINVVIDGQIVKSAVVDSLNDPDIVQTIKDI